MSGHVNEALWISGGLSGEQSMVEVRDVAWLHALWHEVIALLAAVTTAGAALGHARLCALRSA
jgi:Na+-transporting NADH:ubiquinone oxidoreductase subunit NqrB